MFEAPGTFIQYGSQNVTMKDSHFGPPSDDALQARGDFMGFLAAGENTVLHIVPGKRSFDLVGGSVAQPESAQYSQSQRWVRRGRWRISRRLWFESTWDQSFFAFYTLATW